MSTVYTPQNPSASLLTSPGCLNSPLLVPKPASMESAANINLQHFPAAAKLAVNLLKKLQYGCLTISFPDGQQASFGSGNEIQAHLILHNFSLFKLALTEGDIGVAESFMAGDWRCDDLASLLSLLVLNRTAVDALIYGSWWGRLWFRLRHMGNRNSKRQARKNIHAHYDLGNDFYRLWLDPSMTYSSGLFTTKESNSTTENQVGDEITASDNEQLTCAESIPFGYEGYNSKQLLQIAQSAKYRRVMQQLGAEPGAKILEIGCGWGGFAEVAIHNQLSVTGLTLSSEQLAYAKNRLSGLFKRSADRSANRSDKENYTLNAQFFLQDYRDEQDRYDGIVSIEMFEAVGEHYWPSYFNTIKRCLAQQGRAVIQTIVINENLFERYRVTPDFIQTYIFPGGMLPSVSAFVQQATRAGLKVVDHYAFGIDYAYTLKLWRESFLNHISQIRTLGFDERFIRMWMFYLAYCEAAFKCKSTDVMQFTLAHQ